MTALTFDIAIFIISICCIIYALFFKEQYWWQDVTSARCRVIYRIRGANGIEHAR
jgi:hypothetical protein